MTSKSHKPLPFFFPFFWLRHHTRKKVFLSLFLAGASKPLPAVIISYPRIWIILILQQLTVSWMKIKKARSATSLLFPSFIWSVVHLLIAVNNLSTEVCVCPSIFFFILNTFACFQLFLFVCLFFKSCLHSRRSFLSLSIFHAQISVTVQNLTF